MNIGDIKIGDILYFKIKACAYAAPRGIQKRKIVGLTVQGLPQVEFVGYSDFIVRENEIIRVEKGEDHGAN